MFENRMKNLTYYDLTTIKQLPFTYLVNKYLNKDESKLSETNKKMAYSPSCLINSLRTNHYNKLKKEQTMRL